MNKGSDRWRSGIRSWWHAWGEWFEPVYGRFFFVRNPVNAAKKHFLPLKTANFTKTHFIFVQFTLFMLSNLLYKCVKNTSWKLNPRLLPVYPIDKKLRQIAEVSKTTFFMNSVFLWTPQRKYFLNAFKEKSTDNNSEVHQDSLLLE